MTAPLVHIQVIETTSFGIHVDVVAPSGPITFVEILVPGLQGPAGPTGPTGPQGTTDWDDLTGVPATFPPTLPIAQSGITNLVADLAAKANMTGGDSIHVGGTAPSGPVVGDLWVDTN